VFKTPFTLWYFDQNRTVFHKDENNRPYGSAIYKEHWCEKTITEVTTKSFVTSDGIKIPKNSEKIQFLFSKVEDDIFINDKRQHIAEKVASLKDANILKAIEKLLNN